MNWGSFIGGIWTLLLVIGFVAAVKSGSNGPICVITFLLIVTALIIGTIIGEDD